MNRLCLDSGCIEYSVVTSVCAGSDRESDSGYGAMAIGLVPLTYTAPGWTTPPVISGFLATGSLRASLLQIVLIVVDVLLYLPFVANVEKRFKAQEEN